MKLSVYILFFYTTLYGQNFEFDQTINYNVFNTYGDVEKFSVSLNTKNDDIYLVTYKNFYGDYFSHLHDIKNNEKHIFKVDYKTKEKFVYVHSRKFIKHKHNHKHKESEDTLICKSQIIYKDSLFTEFLLRCKMSKDSILKRSSKILLEKNNKFKTKTQLHYLSGYLFVNLGIEKTYSDDFNLVKVVTLENKEYKVYLEMDNFYTDYHSFTIKRKHYSKESNFIKYFYRGREFWVEDNPNSYIILNFIKEYENK